MSIKQNRQPAGTPTGGQFAAGSTGEPQTSLQSPGPVSRPDTAQVHADRATDISGDIAAVETALAKLREEQTRHEVAAFVADLPPQAHEVQVVEWSDDAVNDHGSFDITLGEVTDADGNTVDHHGDITISMRGDDSSPTHWAQAFGESDYPPSSIKVEAVRQWSQANSRPFGSKVDAWSLVSDVEAAKYRQGAETFRGMVREKFPDAHTLEFARDYDDLGETISLAEVRDKNNAVLYNSDDADQSDAGRAQRDDLDTATSGLMPRYGALPPGLQPVSGGDDFVEVQVSQLDDLDGFLGR